MCETNCGDIFFVEKDILRQFGNFKILPRPSFRALGYGGGVASAPSPCHGLPARAGARRSPWVHVAIAPCFLQAASAAVPHVPTASAPMASPLTTCPWAPTRWPMCRAPVCGPQHAAGCALGAPPSNLCCWHMSSRASWQSPLVLLCAVEGLDRAVAQHIWLHAGITPWA